MGCWNKTCGLSNLYIREGEDVLVFALVENWRRSRSETDSFFVPILMPFYAKYDDYGGGYDAHGAGLEYLMNGIKKNLVEKQAGPNQFHDIEVSKSGFNIEMFFNASQEHRLESIFGQDSSTKIEFTMFRADVVETILSKYKIKMFINNGFIGCCFTDIIEHVPSYLAELKRIIKEVQSLKTNKSVSYESKDCFPTFLDFYVVEMATNFAATIMSQGCSQTTKKFVNLFRTIADLLKNDEDSVAELILIEYIKAVVLDAYMRSIRKVWLPGTFEGSQMQDDEPYNIMNMAINNVLEKNTNGEN